MAGNEFLSLRYCVTAAPTSIECEMESRKAETRLAVDVGFR